jgi:STE24 endopeptidase
MFVFWLAWRPGYSYPAIFGTGLSLALFVGVYALLVIGTGLWSRRLSGRLAAPNFNRSLDRLSKVMFAARVFVPVWFFVAMLLFGWPHDVDQLLHHTLMQTVVGLILGTMPAFIAWVGLWWSQYPAEIAFREQGVVSHLEGDLPVHKPPTFRSYFSANLRLQVLFMVVPVLLISLLHDLIRVAATLTVGTRWELNDAENPITWLLAAGLVFLFAPEILRRVLPTEPLPNGPLRRRLESLCRRTGVRYREILLWHTENNLGNAAVMGFIPQLRYILLSDLLLETMTDEQIEAVFAHELGHVVHKHMVWLVVFFAVLSMFVMGGGAWLTKWMAEAGIKDGPAEGVVIAIAYLLKFVFLFGFVSRRFERQADVFAARTMEMTRASVPNVSASEILIAARQLSLATGTGGGTTALALRMNQGPESSHVGNYGATVFASALNRVAQMNNIPVRARSWCHGSIATRMEYLRDLSADPARTRRFDRFMLCMYLVLIFGLFAGAAFCWASNALP